MKKTLSYHDDLIENLKDIDFSIAYLNECLNDEDPRLFLNALRNVLEAQGGLKEAAKKADLNRENLYRMLSDKGNPQINSIYKLMSSLGLRLSVGQSDENKAHKN